MTLYKIGQLAKKANVSERTIDYYTSLGLIKPAMRTPNNYRLYSDETLDRLKRIDELKKEKYSLEEIKRTLDEWDSIAGKEQAVTRKLASLELQMQQLERDVRELAPILHSMKPKQLKKLFRRLTPQSVACIEALFILMNKDQYPFL
jgi:DNA-binding transcriptional MerR regulator